MKNENIFKGRIVTGVGIALFAFALAAYSAVNQTIAVGTMEHSALIGGPATLTMRTLAIEPGEVLGWHYHPGAGAFTIVMEGTLVVEDGCGGETTHPAGSAFLEPPLRIHRGKNLTDQPVVTAQTFIVPMGVGISVATDQRCGVPATVAECRDFGWATFDHPRVFFSQGECVQYVLTGK